MRGVALCFVLFFSSYSHAKEQSLWSQFKDQVSEKYELTVKYWQPRADIVKFYWGHKFKTEVQPKIISAYSLYYKHLGSDISDYIWDSYKDIKPIYDKTLIDTHSYYKLNHPITYRYLSDVPAFIKIGYEKFIFQIWKSLDLIKGNDAVEKHRQALSMAEAAVKAKSSKKYYKENKLLNDLLNEIKYSSYDYGMQECYRAYVVELDMVNAFNTGCSIFVTTSLLEIFKDDKDALRATLAHEVAHGDRGHGLKTMGYFLSSGSKHFTHFSLEWLLWLVTNKKHEFYKKVDEQTHMNIIMDTFAKKAPDLEIEADIVGAEILIRAGYNKNDLKRALIQLHGVNEHFKCNSEAITGSGRDYPDLCRRLEAIESAVR